MPSVRKTMSGVSLSQSSGSTYSLSGPHYESAPCCVPHPSFKRPGMLHRLTAFKICLFWLLLSLNSFLILGALTFFPFFESSPSLLPPLPQPPNSLTWFSLPRSLSTCHPTTHCYHYDLPLRPQGCSTTMHKHSCPWLSLWISHNGFPHSPARVEGKENIVTWTVRQGNGKEVLK